MSIEATTTDLMDVLDRVLDKGIVLDASIYDYRGRGCHPSRAAVPVMCRSGLLPPVGRNARTTAIALSSRKRLPKSVG